MNCLCVRMCIFYVHAPGSYLCRFSRYIGILHMLGCLVLICVVFLRIWYVHTILISQYQTMPQLGVGLGVWYVRMLGYLVQDLGFGSLFKIQLYNKLGRRPRAQFNQTIEGVYLYRCVLGISCEYTWYLVKGLGLDLVHDYVYNKLGWRPRLNTLVD